MPRITGYLKTERVFIISIRQDIDKGFAFPGPLHLEKRLGDFLEEDADERYYLSETRINGLIKYNERNKANGSSFKARFVTEDDIASTLTTRPDKSSGQYLAIKQATKKGYIEAYPGDYVNLQFPNSKTRRGRVTKDYANTLLCNDSQGVITEDLWIRKLTPLECFRLMGFDDKDFDILRMNDISDAQLYKMAGNSIVVDVLEKVFEELIKLYPGLFPFKPVDNQISINEILNEEG